MPAATAAVSVQVPTPTKSTVRLSTPTVQTDGVFEETEDAPSPFVVTERRSCRRKTAARRKVGDRRRGRGGLPDREGLGAPDGRGVVRSRSDRRGERAGPDADVGDRQAGANAADRGRVRRDRGGAVPVGADRGDEAASEDSPRREVGDRRRGGGGLANREGLRSASGLIEVSRWQRRRRSACTSRPRRSQR